MVARGWRMAANGYQTAFGDHENVMKLRGGVNEFCSVDILKTMESYS